MRTWQDLNAKERYRLVRMAQDGTNTIAEICEMFEVSRTTLTKAMEKAEQAAVEALQPKKRGRKAKEEAPQIMELSKENASLAKEVKRWKGRYKFMQAYNELAPLTDPDEIDRKADEILERERRNKRNKKKRQKRKSQKKTAGDGKVVRMFDEGHGERPGNEAEESEKVDQTSGDTSAE